ncbi:MAG: hypothetical protein Q9168_006835 [Polycauliona sp. 1 TL-2023]
MTFNFLGLPREIRDQIYELLLVHQQPINPLFRLTRIETQNFSPGLLRANKTLHLEASPLLYARNRFDLGLGKPGMIASFLEGIGPHHSNNIRHLQIDYPYFYTYADCFALNGGSHTILAKIQYCCANLSTLTFAEHHRFWALKDLEARDRDCGTELVAEAVNLVDKYLRAIPSLREVIVDVYEDDLSGLMKTEMEKRGWTIVTKEREGSPDTSTSDFEDDDFADG